jgi:hypothetical protein
MPRITRRVDGPPPFERDGLVCVFVGQWCVKKKRWSAGSYWSEEEAWWALTELATTPCRFCSGSPGTTAHPRITYAAHARITPVSGLPRKRPAPRKPARK